VPLLRSQPIAEFRRRATRGAINVECDGTAVGQRDTQEIHKKKQTAARHSAAAFQFREAVRDHEAAPGSGPPEKTTQAGLARRAGIRPESLNRIEQGKVMPSLPTVEKIDLALRKAERATAWATC
jgi:ribosome-binding protein aMBF1 (putative translation factor)